MTTLDTVIEMQKQGMNDSEISRNLQSQGFPPQDINDALNQAKIKTALSNQNQLAQQPQASITETGQTAKTFPQSIAQQKDFTNQMSQPPQNQTMQSTQNQFTQQTNQTMQPQQSAFTQQPQQTIPAQSPQTNQNILPSSPPQPSIMQSPQEPQIYPPENFSEDQYAQDSYAGGENYYQDDYYADQGYANSETITEIAQQVVNEKFKEYKKKTGDIAMFKTMIQDKVNIIEQRLKRIEENYDKLQQAIIQKIGEFGENTTMIRRDLDNLHNTTSKLMNPLIDTYRELEKKHKK